MDATPPISQVNKPEPFIHPGATLANNVTVEPFTTIYENVEIGEGTWIGPNVTIFPGARIGKNCKIFPGAIISAEPQDLKFRGEETTVVIGDNTTIRECVTINRATADRVVTRIGSNCLLMAYVHVAHDCEIGDNCILANCVNLAGHVTIENDATLEGLVAVQQFVRIGAYAFIAGTSKVRKNVPPFVKAGREPLSFVGVNSIGLKRRGFNEESIARIEDIYRIIYVRNNNVSRALAALDAELPESTERTRITEFIQASEKGIMRGLTETAQ